MGYRKSFKCMGKTTGGALTESHTQECVWEGARHVKVAYGNDVSPYHCDRCPKWPVKGA